MKNNIDKENNTLKIITSFILLITIVILIVQNITDVENGTGFMNVLKKVQSSAITSARKNLKK